MHPVRMCIQVGEGGGRLDGYLLCVPACNNYITITILRIRSDSKNVKSVSAAQDLCRGLREQVHDTVRLGFFFFF